jgi:hypothetical protein
MKTRLIVLAIVVLAWTILACSLSQLAPDQASRITPTPTRTLKPTFTSTAVPSRTPSPTATPVPTNTPTNTPPPTDTPPPSPTPTVTNTPPPSPTPTQTRRPTPRPTRRPTNTPVPKPTPLPFTGAIVRGYPHCGGYAGVTGQVKHANGSPYPGVAIAVWSDTWVGRVAVSKADGKYDLALTDVPYGEYQVAAVRLETCTERDGQVTALNCQQISNVVKVTVTEFCNVNRVSEVDFTGP